MEPRREESDSDDDENRFRNGKLFDDKLDDVKSLDKNYEDSAPLDYAAEKGKTAKWQTNNNERPGSSSQGKKCTFKKTKGSAGIEGQLCEINLTTMLLLKGKTDEKITSFYLASNMEKADKFDDIVIKYEDNIGKSKAVFIQTKHKTNKKTVTLNDLLSTSESGDFSIFKYFISYRKIKQHFENKENSTDPVLSGNFEDTEFIIYTNAPFDHKGSKCVRELEVDDIDLLKIENFKGKCFKIVLNKETEEEERKRIFALFQNASDCRRLAKELAQILFLGNKIDIKKDIFKSYHQALLQKVIEETAENTGKLRNNFFNGSNVPPQDEKFRTVFFDEATKIFNNMQELQYKTIKLPIIKDINSNGCSDLPADDPIEEHEVEDFLHKFRLCASQPNEKELEASIKDILKQYYKIEQDIDAVFADVSSKVRNWWQCQDDYLMKDNKFFEDSAKVSVQFDVLEPVTSFTGREEQLENLHEILQKEGEAFLSQIAVITGMGGIGKSELARKYLKNYQKDHYDTNAVWINAENASTTAQSFRRLAQEKLKIDTKSENGKEKDINILVEDIYNFFAKYNRKSIFVFDNAEKQGQNFDKLLPSGLFKPYVIITSRDKNWDDIKNLELNVLSHKDAETFVRNALKNVIEMQDGEIQGLIKEMDHFPLALRQAAAFINVQNQKLNKWSTDKFTITSYLQLYHENAKKLLDEGTRTNHDRYTLTVMKTWKTTLEKIEQSNEQAVIVLGIIAYLAPDQIPVDHIFKKKSENNDVAISAIELLDQYSMVRLEAGKISVHRLVQQVTRIELEERGQNEEAIELTFQFLGNPILYGSEKMEDLYKMRRMVLHFEVFLKHIENLLQTTPDKREDIEKSYLDELLGWMVDGYHYISSKRSKDVLKRKLELRKRYFGNDHIEVAATLNDLGNAYQLLGDPHKQKQLLERSLTIYETFYGPDHIQVARTLSNLGSAYGSLGDPHKQKQLLERSLTIYETFYGPDHIQVARTLSNLGSAYGSLGDPHKQKQLLERSLTIYENFYGPDHIQVATTLNYLGTAYGSLGDLHKQKELLESSQTIYENFYGPDHILVARTLSNLGNAYGSLGDPHQQKQLLERSLTIYENFYGPDHIEVARTLSNLGDAYGSLGEPRKEKQLLERSLTIYENFYGPDHIQVASELSNLGNAYGSLGDPHKQKQLLERSLTIYENFYGPDHIEVASALSNLGNAYGSLGEPRKEKQLLERSLTIYETFYGPDHIQVASELSNLGNAYGSLGEPRKEKQLLERSLTIYETFYGPDHIQVARTLSNLGDAYGSLGDPHKQKQLLERSLTIFENFYGPDHIQVARTLSNLGDAFGSLDDPHKQKQLLERSLTIYENFYGPDHIEVARTLSNLGDAFGSLDDPHKQKQLLERSLTIYENFYGPDHIQVAATLNDLGNAYQSLGDPHQQKQLLERSLTIYENFYGPDHIQVAIKLSSLGNAYGSLGDPHKQKELLERSLTIYENFYGPDHILVAASLNYLGNAYGSLGDPHKQKELLERSLTIYENFYGPDHIEVATSLNYLGNANGSLGEPHKEKQLLELSLTIKE